MATQLERPLDTDAAYTLALDAVHAEFHRLGLGHLEGERIAEEIAEEVAQDVEDGFDAEVWARKRVGWTLDERPDLDPDYVPITNPRAHEGGARL